MWFIPPLLSASARHWIIGDIHGCHQPLDRMLEALPCTDHLVFCGDVVGRGPDVPDVADQVWRLVKQSRATWLMGNHEQRLLQDPALQLTVWPGDAALRRQWHERLNTLPLWFQGDGWVATHAGFDAEGRADLHIREPFWTQYDGRYGRVVVAHTPGHEVRRKGAIVMIDTGAVYGGQLTAFCPETDAVVQVQGLVESATMGPGSGPLNTMAIASSDPAEQRVCDNPC